MEINLYVTLEVPDEYMESDEEHGTMDFINDSLAGIADGLCGSITNLEIK